MNKVSIIVPMYNAEKYIVGCVNGLLSQTLHELEVIIVNDCSTDNSMALCREHFGGNPRVKLVDQPKNMGPGMARNAGIECAEGEYIAFADSDDGVRGDAYLRMYSAAKETGADVLHVTGALIQTVEDAPDDLNLLTDDELYHVTFDEGEKITGLTALPGDLSERLRMYLSHQIHWTIWNKLYKRSFLNEHHIRFGETKMAEDQVFCFECLCKAANYVKMPGEWYLYRIGGASLTRGQKQLKTLLTAVETQIRIPGLLRGAMEGVPYFDNNADKKLEIINYVIRLLESSYVLPACDKLGSAGLKECEMLKELFEKYYGEHSDYVYFSFLNSHENVENVTDLNELLNSPGFWKARKEQEAKENNK